jgi:hypothetical protein
VKQFQNGLLMMQEKLVKQQLLMAKMVHSMLL